MSNKIYFTPGPSQLYHTFQEHFKSAMFHDVGSISHRSSQMISIIQHTTESLKELLGIPSDFEVYFVNSANEVWDRLLQNVVKESSHHFINGAFSQKFYDFAQLQSLKSTQTKSPDGHTFAALAVQSESELIAVTKNETSVGFDFIDTDLSILRAQNPDKIIALDIVSAAPGVPIDFTSIDSAYFSVQKGFGMPPGLGVWIVNEKCHERAIEKSTLKSIGSYRSLPNLKKFGSKHQTPETPNSLYIYILGKIAIDMLGFGKQRIQNETTYKATLLKQMVENHPSLEHFVADKKYRSKTTIVSNMAKNSRIKEELALKKMIIGTGYGVHKNAHLRFANFPSHSKESIELLVDLIMDLE